MNEELKSKINHTILLQRDNSSIHELQSLLQNNDTSFDILTDCLTNPQSIPIEKSCLEECNDSNYSWTMYMKRSYRIMNLITKDTTKHRSHYNNYEDANTTILNAYRAQSLSKKIFTAFQTILFSINATTTSSSSTKTAATAEDATHEKAAGLSTKYPHLPHLNATLDALLKYYPSSVISACTSGGKDAILSSLAVMLELSKFTASFVSNKYHHIDSSSNTTTLTQPIDLNNVLDKPHSSSAPKLLLDLFTDIILVGITGKLGRVATQDNNLNGGGNTNNFLYNLLNKNDDYGSNLDPNKLVISKSHRRKFVHGLSDWGLMSQLISCIVRNYHYSSHHANHKDELVDVNSNTDMMVDEDILFHDECEKYDPFYAENVCDVLLLITDIVCHPNNFSSLPNQQQQQSISSESKEIDESIGEEMLFTSSGKMDIVLLIKTLSSSRCNDSSTTSTSSPTSTTVYFSNNRSTVDTCNTASRALLYLFDLATGKSKMKALPSSATAATLTSTDDGSIEAKAQDQAPDDETNDEMDNKLMKSGFTYSIHKNIVSNMEHIVKAMDVYMEEQTLYSSNQELIEGEDLTHPTSSFLAVKHPGHLLIAKPFTLRRLNLITLFADVLCFPNSQNSNNNELSPLKKKEVGVMIDPAASSKAALDKVMTLPIQDSGENDKQEIMNKIWNPWPGLCDLLFNYPENNMYQIQFSRLLHAICMVNHEPTLKLVVQKCKFITRSIKEISKSVSSHRGVLLRCLNILRLHSQSLSSSSFLRHYLDSHDVYKSFQDELKMLTREQELPGGGIALPQSGTGASVPATGDINIDLGSSFAVQLGFPLSIKPYVADLTTEVATKDDVLSLAENESPSSKKKKKNKKKKK